MGDRKAGRQTLETGTGYPWEGAGKGRGVGGSEKSRYVKFT